MIRRMLCIALAVAFLPLCASASDLPSAIAALPDDDLMDLYGMVVLEMYQRGLSPDTVIQHVDLQQFKPTPTKTPQATATAPDLYALPALHDVYSDIINSIPQIETFTTYDPPSTPHPTYHAMADLQYDDTVWVAKSGKRYHTTPDCSGMKNPSAVSLESAISSGRTPCRDCAWWMVPEEE